MKIYCAKSYKLEDVLAEYSRYLGKNVWVRCCRASDYDEVMRNPKNFRFNTWFIRPLDVYEENGAVLIECDWATATDTGRGTYDFQHRVYYADHLALINPDKVYKTGTLFKAPTYKDDKILAEFVGKPYWIGIRTLQDSRGWGSEPFEHLTHIKILSKDKNMIICNELPSDIFTSTTKTYAPLIQTVRKYTDTFEVVMPLDVVSDEDIQDMLDVSQTRYGSYGVY